jgi:hypothetical protein
LTLVEERKKCGEWRKPRKYICLLIFSPFSDDLIDFFCYSSYNVFPPALIFCWHPRKVPVCTVKEKQIGVSKKSKKGKMCNFALPKCQNEDLFFQNLK